METIMNFLGPILILFSLIIFLFIDIRKQLMELRFPEGKNPPAPPDREIILTREQARNRIKDYCSSPRLEEFDALKAENKGLRNLNNALWEELEKLKSQSAPEHCQQCSPEHLEAMKEAAKMWVELAKHLNSRLLDLEKKAEDV